jgi:hypothetical protein
MDNVINLNRARKAKSVAEDKAIAATNRVRFGRTKVEKSREALDRLRAEDAHQNRALDHDR